MGEFPNNLVINGCEEISIEDFKLIVECRRRKDKAHICKRIFSRCRIINLRYKVSTRVFQAGFRLFCNL